MSLCSTHQVDYNREVNNSLKICKTIAFKTQNTLFYKRELNNAFRTVKLLGSVIKWRRATGC
jgi:hypothetical protein